MKSVTKNVRKPKLLNISLSKMMEKTRFRRVTILLTYSPLHVSIPMYALLMLSSPTFKFSAHVKKEKKMAARVFSVSL